MLFVVAAGFMIDGQQNQFHLRRSLREPKERTFLRPDRGPASGWKDIPTTAREENATLPPEITLGGGIAMPGISKATEIYPGDGKRIRVMTAKSPVAIECEDHIVDDIELNADDQCIPHVCIHHCKKCGGCRYKRFFDTAGLNEAFKTVPNADEAENDEDDTDSDDDKTASMDTEDKPNQLNGPWG
jgi:hypothetical protein